MIINIRQRDASAKNQFDILQNNNFVYQADLPFIQVDGVFGADKLQRITLNDSNGVKYRTKYNFIDSKLEELIPMKYLFTGSQKFNQFTVIDNNNNELFSIYMEQTHLLKSSYVIKMGNSNINVFSVEDGRIRHFPVYFNETQIGEIIKSNVVIDAKDEYIIYLKDEFSACADALTMLVLYLDRIEYNSSYLANNTVSVSYKKSISLNNKYYDSNWIANNFSNSPYYQSVSDISNKANEQSKKDLNSILKIMGIIFAVIVIGIIIGYFVLFKK